MRYQGRITTWKDEQGFGFITLEGNGERVFVHIKSFSNRHRRPKEGDLVTYELAVNDNGRPQASAIRFIGEQPPVLPGRSRRFPVITVCFLAFVAGTVIVGRLPITVFALYVIASIVTFCAYAFDKSAASRNEWRTRESTLHLFALLGGWPGALAAQSLLRHKSAKVSFQGMFRVTVLLNCGALGFFLSPSGTKIFRSLPGDWADIFLEVFAGIFHSLWKLIIYLWAVK